MKMRIVPMMIAMGLLVVRAFAGPIPSPLLDPKVWGPQKGESKIYNAGGTYFITVDWLVRWDDVLEIYEYFYQIENASSTVIGRFTITPKGPVSSVSAIEADIDDAPYSHNISGEDVELGLYSTMPDPNQTGFSVIGDVVWAWKLGEEVPSGRETVILYLTSPMPPVYGYAEAKDSAPGPFSTDYTGSQRVPVPSPEPVSLILLLFSLSALRIVRNKMVK